MINSPHLQNVILNNINIVVSDISNKITFVSQHYARLMGYAVDEIIDKPSNMFSHPSDSTEAYNAYTIQPILNKSSEWSGILKNQKKNGDAIYFTVDTFKDFDEDGNHIGFHTIHTHITKNIESPQNCIFDNPLSYHNNDHVVTCLCANSNQVLEISEPFLKLIERRKLDIIKEGLTFTDLISTDSIYYHDLEGLLYDYYDKDNDVIIELGDSTGIFKKYKLLIIPIHVGVENARVYKLIDIAKQSNKIDRDTASNNTLLANLSHEIKTPLNAIIGFLTLLQLRETDTEKLNYIDIILNSSNHITDITNNVIDFTGMDSDKINIVPRSFTPKDLIRTIEVFFARGLEKKIDFTTYFDPDLPDIMEQDIIRIRQIITNLVSNAIKFVEDKGEITIHVHYKAGNLYFSIKDNGIGMSATQLKGIFNPFSQASVDIKLNYGGTGLGLSVVKKLVDAMSGEIIVDSTLSVGTTFTVNIPVKAIRTHCRPKLVHIDGISVYTPSFSTEKFDILEKYISHFSGTTVKKITNFSDIGDELLIVNLIDVDNIDSLSVLGEKHNIIVLKTMSDVGHIFDETENIIELVLPLCGSELYSAFNTLLGCNSVGESNNDVILNGKILIADDLLANRTLLIELLSKYDVTLDFAINGSEAIQMFTNSISQNKSSYDLILLDMNMPIINGAQAARKIRNYEHQANIEHTPLVALSANHYNKDDKSLLDMDAYLPKPIDINHLLATIIQYTNNGGPVIDSNNFDKIEKIKEIKECFLTHNIDCLSLINKYESYFEESEYKILMSITQIYNDKRKFIVLYNRLMKSIRKNKKK